ncbi:hypothetical protein [Streptomyces sp. NPDC020983]|uniref:hypothetical protein n=1 Tax=Streptomyces sp. NPDC020983 TaxID=3365106 RepID=UPI0037AE5EDC
MSTIPASTAPAARRWLYEQLTAQIQPDPDNTRASLLICYDEPSTDQPSDIISVGGVTREIAISAMVGSGGAGWLEERYTIALIIDVARGGDDAAGVFDRACTLLDQVVAIIRADPTLGGAVLVGRPVSSQTEGLALDDHTGRQSVVNLGVECYARI